MSKKDYIIGRNHWKKPPSTYAVFMAPTRELNIAPVVAVPWVAIVPYVVAVEASGSSFETVIVAEFVGVEVIRYCRL